MKDNIPGFMGYYVSKLGAYIQDMSEEVGVN